MAENSFEQVAFSSFLERFDGLSDEHWGLEALRQIPC